MQAAAKCWRKVFGVLPLLFCHKKGRPCLLFVRASNTMGERAVEEKPRERGVFRKWEGQ